ncbi:hypothetical protein AB5I41_14565 [Sphingomonas sp. MMS24-JH45]
MDRTGILRDAIEDVLFAQCYPTMDAPALGGSWADAMRGCRRPQEDCSSTVDAAPG